MLSSSIFSIFRFARGMILVTTQENLLFPQSYYFLQTLSLNIFHKKLLNICHANGSQTVTSFAMPSRILGAPTVLHRMRLVWNFVFAKFFSISKKLTPQSSKTKPFVLVILQKKKKDLPHKFLLSTSTNIFINYEYYTRQKQLPEVFCKKRCL